VLERQAETSATSGARLENPRRHIGERASGRKTPAIPRALGSSGFFVRRFVRTSRATFNARRLRSRPGILPYLRPRRHPDVHPPDRAAPCGPHRTPRPISATPCGSSVVDQASCSVYATDHPARVSGILLHRVDTVQLQVRPGTKHCARRMILLASRDQLLHPVEKAVLEPAGGFGALLRRGRRPPRVPANFLSMPPIDVA
jgi:hypothetical protein